MEPRGCRRSQPRRESESPRRPKTSQSLAAGCDQLLETFHGKEGSTVRVRQRTLQNASITGFLFSDLLAGARTWGRYGALLELSSREHPPRPFCWSWAQSNRRPLGCERVASTRAPRRPVVLTTRLRGRRQAALRWLQ